MFASGKTGPKQFALVSRKFDKMQKVSPAIKQMLDKQMPNLAEIDGSIIPQPTMTASTILKQIDSTFESFFHKRDYTERNFSFYLQVLA